MQRDIPATLPMLGRAQVRLAAFGALTRAALTDRGHPVLVQSPGDWSIPASLLPVVIVRTGAETKTSTQRGMPTFTTSCTLEVKATIEAITALAAQDAIEALWFSVERALLTDYSLVGMLQQFAGIDSVLEIRAEGSRHLAGIAAAFHCEYFESFDPFDAIPAPQTWPVVTTPGVFESIDIHVDTGAPFDADGTYPNPPFPDSIAPAPRTSGPDGRDEGYLDITLPPPDSK
jgi:hypothetical protein